MIWYSLSPVSTSTSSFSPSSSPSSSPSASQSVSSNNYINNSLTIENSNFRDNENVEVNNQKNEINEKNEKKNKTDNKNIFRNLMIQELYKDFVEVTECLASSLSFSSKTIKFDGTKFLQSSDIFYNFFLCSKIWLHSFENSKMESEVCYHFLRILLLPLVDVKDSEQGSLLMNVSTKLYIDYYKFVKFNFKLFILN